MAAELHDFTHDEPERRLASVLKAAELEELVGEESTVNAVIERLHDVHPGIRQAALDVLGRLVAHRGLSVSEGVALRAVELTEDESPLVRAEAAVALALFADDRELPMRNRALRRLLHDGVPGVRQEAAAALGDLADAGAAEPLARLLDDPNEGVRFEAAFALAALRDPRARPTLERALDPARTRLEACEGLRRLGDPAAIPALSAMAARFFVSWADRLTAWGVAYSLGDHGMADKVLARTSARSREEQIYALALIGSHRIAEGAPVLIETVRGKNEMLREVAVRALGELGAGAKGASAEWIAELTTVLEALESAESPELRREATEALQKVKARLTSKRVD